MTLGCRVNQYESQALSEHLAALGYKNADFRDRCDVYVINTCAVTEESVRKSRQMVRRASKRNPEAFLAVCGCASQLSPDLFEDIPGVKVICGTRNKDELVTALKAHEASLPHPRRHISTPSGELSPTAITRFDRTRAYVKIQDGCNGKCTYCIIPTVRGGIVLRPEQEILTEVTTLAKGGCHEVVLTGIETAAYGKGLPTLIEKIAAIQGIERIRLGSLEPSFLKPTFIDAIAKIPQVCHHFHLSVQNGSNRILAAMRRKYNTATLEANVAYIRSVMPDVNFSADIIVGFPGETEKDFEDTCNLVRRIGFLHLHIFTYSKRPGTEAATMPNQLSESVKSDRLHRLSTIAAEEKAKILHALLQADSPLTILAETVEHGLLVGHTDTFVECGVELPSDTDPASLRGQLVTLLPSHSCHELLIGGISSHEKPNHL